MKQELITELISKTYKIDSNIVKEAINIIESNKSLVLDDVFLANTIASNMKISPENAVNIAMKYNKIKDKTVEQLNEEINEINNIANKKSKKVIIVSLIFVIIICIILFVSLKYLNELALILDKC